MDPTVLALALAQPAATRAAVLAVALTGGTTGVTFDGRTVEYRSLNGLGRALSALHAAETPRPAAPAKPSPTFRAKESGDGSSSQCLARIPCPGIHRSPSLPDAAPGAA